MGASETKCKKLLQSEIDFLRKNTSFSEQEIHQWYTSFRKDCPDGRLTKTQFVSIYNTLWPEGNADKLCEHVFRAFDNDGNGYIDFKEFMLSVNCVTNGSPEDKLKLAFKMYDIDQNGSVDKDELKEIIRSICSIAGAQECNINPDVVTNNVFSKIDVNHDGMISEEEFVRVCSTDEELVKLLTTFGIV